MITSHPQPSTIYNQATPQMQPQQLMAPSRSALQRQATYAAIYSVARALTAAAASASSASTATGAAAVEPLSTPAQPSGVPPHTGADAAVLGSVLPTALPTALANAATGVHQQARAGGTADSSSLARIMLSQLLSRSSDGQPAVNSAMSYAAASSSVHTASSLAHQHYAGSEHLSSHNQAGVGFSYVTGLPVSRSGPGHYAHVDPLLVASGTGGVAAGAYQSHLQPSASTYQPYDMWSDTGVTRSNSSVDIGPLSYPLQSSLSSSSLMSPVAVPVPMQLYRQPQSSALINRDHTAPSPAFSSFADVMHSGAAMPSAVCSPVHGLASAPPQAPYSQAHYRQGAPYPSQSPLTFSFSNDPVDASVQRELDYGYEGNAAVRVDALESHYSPRQNHDLPSSHDVQSRTQPSLRFQSLHTAADVDAHVDHDGVDSLDFRCSAFQRAPE